MKILRKLLAALLYPAESRPHSGTAPLRRDEDDQPDYAAAAEEEDNRKPAHFIPFPRY